MNAFGVLSDGKFDATKAKAAIGKLNADNKAWTSEVRRNYFVDYFNRSMDY